MAFKDLVLQNRSCRSFDESFKITRQQLCDMIECARLSASFKNMQTLKYYLSYSCETNSVIQSLTKWGAALPQLSLPPAGHGPTAFIVICYDKKIGGEDGTRFLKDVGICAQTIMLAATEMGINGCMIGNFSPAKVADALSLSDDLLPVLILGLGKSIEHPVITEAPDGKTTYYRDESNTHYVPKRSLTDELLN